MRHVMLFERFSGGPVDPFDSMLRKIVTTKYFDKKDLPYYRENLKHALHDIGIESKMSFIDIVNHKGFDTLEDKFKDPILALAGRSDFVKALVTAFQKFPNARFLENNKELDNLVYLAVEFKNSLEDDSYPTTYIGLDNQTRESLKKEMSASDIHSKLSPEDLKIVKRVVKGRYENFIKKYLSDDSISKMISEQIKLEHGDDEKTYEWKVANQTIHRVFPEFFNFVKEKIMSGDQITSSEWGSLKVNAKMVDSKYSAVVSSSFTTFYQYDVEITAFGKTFKFKDVCLESDHYSGGWN